MFAGLLALDADKEPGKQRLRPLLAFHRVSPRTASDAFMPKARLCSIAATMRSRWNARRAESRSGASAVSNCRIPVASR
jgi:hypothetical protein